MDLTTLARFHIAPGYDPALPATWVWEDRSADVNHKDGVGLTITGDRGDEVSEVEAGSAILEVDNAGGHYCDQNPLGRWYGRLALGCPARWGTISGAEAWTATTSNGWGIPDAGISWSLDGSASDWSSSGGIGQVAMATANLFRTAELVGANARNGEATFVCAAPVVATGAALVNSLAVRRSAAAQILFSVDFGTGGTLGVRIKRQVGAGINDIGSATIGTYTATQRIKVRCQWDGQDMRIRAWPEASAEPTTWSATATDDQCTSSAVAVHSWRVAGNTNAGSLTYTYDDLEILAVEIVGTLPELPVRWDPTATVSWAPLQIAGITRRLSQGEDVIESPIERQLSAQSPQGYWTLEDGADAKVAAPAVPRGLSGAVTGVVFGSADCPPGALSAATLTTLGTSRIVGRLASWSVPQDGYAAMCYLRLPTLPPSSTSLKMFEISATGTITRWVIYCNDSTFSIEGYLADGTLSIAPGASFFVIDPTKWFAMQLETAESGGTVNWSLLWHQVGATSFLTSFGSFAGTADRITAATIQAPVDGTLASHLWCGPDELPFVDGVFMQVSAAYPGEPDTARIKRVFGEKGISITVEPGAGEPLGPQKLGQVLDVARAAEAGGLGVLYETGAGYAYRPRRARYNRPVDMTLSMGATGDISDAPQPATQDLRIRNFWKVTRDGGSSATDSDPAHIARYGRRPDTATIGIYTDGRLLDHASWRVHLGTWGEMRWPQLVIDLTDRPTQLAAWRGRPFGARITVTGIPAQGPIGQSLDLIVEGWSQEISSHGWRVTVNCSPAKPWDVGVYGTSRYDSATTTTAGTLPTGTIGQTGVSLPISTTNRREVWSTTATPYGWVISGEQVTVTAMTAASGTGPYTQTATITRGANGLVKAHAAGEPVRLATPARYAL